MKRVKIHVDHFVGVPKMDFKEEIALVFTRHGDGQTIDVWTGIESTPLKECLLSPGFRGETVLFVLFTCLIPGHIKEKISSEDREIRKMGYHYLLDYYYNNILTVEELDDEAQI